MYHRISAVAIGTQFAVLAAEQPAPVRMAAYFDSMDEYTDEPDDLDEPPPLASGDDDVPVWLCRACDSPGWVKTIAGGWACGSCGAQSFYDASLPSEFVNGLGSWTYRPYVEGSQLDGSPASPSRNEPQVMPAGRAGRWGSHAHRKPHDPGDAEAGDHSEGRAESTTRGPLAQGTGPSMDMAFEPQMHSAAPC